MIKCFGSGKLLKQFFIISLISCFIFLGNSFASSSCDGIFSNISSSLGKTIVFNGGQIHSVGSTYTSTQSNSIDHGVLKYGNFLTQSLGYGKNLFAITSSDLIFRTSDGLPYYYRSDSIQGVFDNYIVCDNINPDGFDSGSSHYIGVNNCTVENLTSSSVPVLASFFNTVSSSDYFGYTYSIGSNFKRVGLCVSSSSLSKSVCFMWESQWDSSANSECRLTNTLNLSNVDFGTISSSILFNSPGVSGNPGIDLNGSQDVNLNNNLTGDYVYSNCSYQQIFDYLESFGYNEYTCFGGLDNFDLYDSTLSYSPTPLSGKTLGQILSYSNARDTPNDWFIFWNGLYLDRYNSNYNAMRESYPAVYRTWFDLYYRYGGSSLIFDTVREYCAMKQLDIDFNTTTYKGQYFKNTCTSIQNGSQYGYDPGSGTGDSENVVGVNRVGIGNLGSGNDVKTSNDPAVFIQDFFNELKASLPTRYDLGGGFLPVYIITFLCALVLFRFLSH